MDGFEKGIEGSNVKVLDRQFANWNRDDAFKVMQDYLTKYPKIDVVWCRDDDMAVGVLEAIQQAKRTDIQFVVGGAGSKDMIKKVMDGDKMIPVDVLYPPAMVATAMELTAATFFDQVPVRGTYIARRHADHQGQRRRTTTSRTRRSTREEGERHSSQKVTLISPVRWRNSSSRCGRQGFTARELT